jgi:hypothetical protein
MASATGLARAGERVWELPGVVARLRARGEGEGRTESTGRGDVLSCPGTCQCTLWRVWASWARQVLAGVSLSSTNGEYEHDQGSEYCLFDKVRGTREGG